MEMLTIQRLKFSILVFLQVLIFVVVSFWLVYMLRSGLVRGQSFGKLTAENGSDISFVIKTDMLNDILRLKLYDSESYSMKRIL